MALEERWRWGLTKISSTAMGFNARQRLKGNKFGSRYQRLTLGKRQR